MFEEQSDPYYCTARLWDDGLIEPADTRDDARGSALTIGAMRAAGDRRTVRSIGCKDCREARHVSPPIPLRPDRQSRRDRRAHHAHLRPARPPHHRRLFRRRRAAPCTSHARRPGGAHRAGLRRAKAISTSTRSSPRPRVAGARRHSSRLRLSRPRTPRFCPPLRGRRAHLRRPLAGCRSQVWARRSSPKRDRRGAACRPCPAITATPRTTDAPRQAVERIGFPVLIKASAGGGGRGMRRVRSRRRSRRSATGRRGEAEAPRSATPACCSRSSSPIRAISKCSSPAIASAAWCICSNAIARSSATTRRCSRRRRRPTCPTSVARAAATTPR